MAMGTALTIRRIFFQTGTSTRKLVPTQIAKNTVIIFNPLHALAISSGGGVGSRITFDASPGAMAGIPRVCRL